MFQENWFNVAAQHKTPANQDGTVGSLPRTAEEVFHAFAPRVYSVARRMLGHETAAGEVTEEVLLRVLRNVDALPEGAGFDTWLHRLTVSATLRCRNRARHPELPFDPPLHFVGTETGATGDAQGLSRETHALVEGAIADLPETYRDVYVLADIEGLGHPEIGELLQLSLPNVKSRLHRARLLLGKVLTPHFDGAA